MKEMKSIERFLSGQREKDEAKMTPVRGLHSTVSLQLPSSLQLLLRLVRWLQWVKALSPDPKDMSESPRTLTVAERTDSYKLFYDPHTCVCGELAHTQ